MKRKIISLCLLLLATSMLLANGQCTNSAEYEQERGTNQLQEEANKRLGMPNIVNFTERRFAKMLLELRDKEVSTFTYYLDMHGKKHLLCKSIGYGLPYSVQYTNPEKYWGNGATLPQADPNGLYMPDGLSATFVMCVDKKGDIKPIYIEPEIIVSPFELN